MVAKYLRACRSKKLRLKRARPSTSNRNRGPYGGAFTASISIECSIGLILLLP